MKKFLSIVLVMLSVQVFAQTNPITAINITLPANPDANTANWGTGTSLFMISATSQGVNGRIDPHVEESKILVIIKQNGKTVCGAYTSSTAPEAGFSTLTKVWSGGSAASFLGKDCMLAPGDYELSVQFFGYGVGKTVALSDEKIKPFTIRGNDQQAYQPPQGILPADGTAFSETDIKKPIIFRWTPVIPKPQEPVIYRLSVWQLMKGQTGPQAIKANQPILTKDVDNMTQAVVPNLINGPCQPPYLCSFVWNLQALNRDGKPVGGNNGTSETHAFNIYTPAEVNQKDTSNAPLVELVSPLRGLEQSDARPAFTWKVNNSDKGLTFSVKLIEITEKQSPEDAIKTNSPVFEQSGIKETSLAYPSSAKPLDPGKTYIWGVTATDRGGKQIDGTFTRLLPIPTPGGTFNFCNTPVNVNPSPATFCAGQPANIQISSSISGYSWQISGPNGFSLSGTSTGATQGLSFTPPSTPGTYNYTVSISKTVYIFHPPFFHFYQIYCGSANFTVTVLPQLVPTINKTQICNGQDAQLNIPNLPAGSTVNWLWRDGNSGSWTLLGQGNPINTNAIIASCTTGQSYVTRNFQAQVSGWPSTCPIPTVSLQIWCPTVAGTITGAANFCITPPNTQTLTLNYVGGTYSSIQWAGPNGLLGNATQQQVTVGPAAGSYTFTATVRNSLSCNPVTTQVVVKVENPLTITVTGDNNNNWVCPNAGVQLTANITPAPPAGSTIKWEYLVNCTGSAWVATNNTGSTQFTNPIGNMGPYPSNLSQSLCWRATVTTPLGICAPAVSGTYTINIIQPPCTPTITASGNSLPKCPGSTVTLTAATACGTSPFTWQWYLNGAPVGTGQSIAAILPGNYTVEVFNQNQCDSRTSAPFKVTDCVNLVTIAGPCTTNGATTATLTAIVNSQPNPPPQNNPACGGPYTYLWSNGATTASIQVTPTATTTYTVVVTSGNGTATDCTTTASFTVKVCH